jgi:putative thioredoxin
MKASDLIITVSESNFEYDVIAYSQRIPVVVDFWAPWCIPCRTQSPMLERFTEEAAGAFRLAKINIDENVNLALRYNVRSIPAVKAFRDGQVVSEFVGLQPELRLREFLGALAPSENDLIMEKAKSILLLHQWQEAEKAFRKVLETSPNNTAALLGLCKSLLGQGRVVDCQKLLRSFPASREYHSAETLRPLADAIIRAQNAGFIEDDPLLAAYRNSLRLVEKGNLPAAMDGFLDILKQDKHYQDDELRRVAVALLEVMGDEDPLTRQYRNELATILF